MRVVFSFCFLVWSADGTDSSLARQALGKDDVKLSEGSFPGWSGAAPRSGDILEGEVNQLRLIPSTQGSRNQATLQLTLRHTQPELSEDAEYVTALPLPPGIFVNGFRLHINGTPVPGRITEKKTALWIYSTIRDVERRDPAVLSYTADNELELRVFPIQPRVPTTVEIDFLLPYSVDASDLSPASLTPREAIEQLGRFTTPYLARTETGGLFAGQAIASKLPRVKRERYLHLIRDRSKDNAFDGDRGTALQTLRSRFPDVHTVRVSLANYEVASQVSTPLAWDQLPAFIEKDFAARIPRNSGLALDLALAHAYQQHVDLDLDAHPPHQPPPPEPLWVILGRTAQNTSPDWSRSEAWEDFLGPHSSQLNVQPSSVCEGQSIYSAGVAVFRALPTIEVKRASSPRLE